MKVLLDTCVWGGAVKVLETAGHEVVWGGDWSEDPGDEEIIAIAHKDGRILVTLDKDFGEIAIVKGRAHCGIIRLVNIPARIQGIACMKAIETHGRELQSGAIITVEPGRLRIRPPDKNTM
jgi:predicted nuclease of predicted toxin-antitoxin system